MGKYIDAEAFKRRILSYGTVHEGDRIQIPFYKHYFAKAYVAILRWVCEEVDDTPTADVVEVRHGRWIEQEADMDTIYECSVCGEPFVTIEGTPADNLWHYCPNCGAKMDEVGEDIPMEYFENGGI